MNDNAVCLTHRDRWPRNLGELLQEMHFRSGDVPQRMALQISLMGGEDFR